MTTRLETRQQPNKRAPHNCIFTDEKYEVREVKSSRWPWNPKSSHQDPKKYLPWRIGKDCTMTFSTWAADVINNTAFVGLNQSITFWCSGWNKYWNSNTSLIWNQNSDFHFLPSLIKNLIWLVQCVPCVCLPFPYSEWITAHMELLIANCHSD